MPVRESLALAPTALGLALITSLAAGCGGSAPSVRASDRVEPEEVATPDVADPGTTEVDGEVATFDEVPTSDDRTTSSTKKATTTTTTAASFRAASATAKATTTTKATKSTKATTATTKAPPKTTTTRKPAPTTTTTRAYKSSESGEASWYRFEDGTCAHKTLPKGTIVRVTNNENGKTATCRVADRGPYGEGRIIDLDDSVFAQLAPLSQGVFDATIAW